MGSTNSLPKGQTVPCVILGCTTYLRSLTQSAIRGVHMSYILHCHSILYLLQTTRFIRSLLPQLPVSWLLLSCHLFWACIFSSPAAAFPAVASLQSHFLQLPLCSHISCSCLSAVTFPAVASLLSHFLQSLSI